MNQNSNYDTMRICATKHELPDHIKNTKGDFSNLAAAFYAAKVWDKNSTIKIKFLDENPDFGLKPVQMQERQRKQNQGERGACSGESTKNRLTAPIFRAQLSNMI